MSTILGQDLRVGDTIEVWWTPNRDTILSLKPYTGSLQCIPGAQIASFGQLRCGMTIVPGDEFEVLNR